MGGPPRTKNNNFFPKQKGFSRICKKNCLAKFGGFGPGKDSSEDLGAHRLKIIQKYALAAIFWTKRKF